MNFVTDTSSERNNFKWYIKCPVDFVDLTRKTVEMTKDDVLCKGLVGNYNVHKNDRAHYTS